MIDMLAEVHPAAKIAFNIVSTEFNVLKKHKEENQLVLNLYDTMLNVYLNASEDEILQRRDWLHRVYECLFEQTIECSYFIEGYVKKRIGGMFTLNLSDKAKEFCEGFKHLRNQLHDDVAKDGLVVTLGIQEQVNELSTYLNLRIHTGIQNRI
ncbi:uncharacterized protein EV420DRAFT_1543618 [Desarmillaria tabescens]|uniref:Uncharacterized protein n=1 Tax=Armillaria tabescens TaxID=1929756 RepID=A0AA39N630_ARMTA|nr:uncharacterized protein EV420DRAFT_1543618 [Desarmillaria tabescens]KAK0458660.1 hypothetical protein EV420DRAFT_1543618 [Desarmillaria tabescens]